MTAQLKKRTKTTAYGVSRHGSGPQIVAAGTAMLDVMRRIDAIYEGRKSGKKVGILDLKPTSCRWPIGDPASVDFRFCGSDITAGGRGSYCSYHASVAYVRKP